jgi:hypothetical protein
VHGLSLVHVEDRRLSYDHHTEIGFIVSDTHGEQRSETTDEFATNVLQSMRDIFWQPEIERRGGLEVTGPITRALAVLPRSSSASIRFNEEFELVAHASVNTAVQAGDPVTVENVDAIERLEPVDIDPDAGWVVYVQLPDGRAFLQFDFRRNRARGTRLLKLAHQYLDVATLALEQELIGPCLDTSHTAAELAVTAMMYLTDDDAMSARRHRHERRLHWLNEFTTLGNAPRDYHQTLVTLTRLRPAARYGDPPLEVRLGDARELHAAVQGLVNHAEDRVAPLAGERNETEAT